LEVTIVPVVAGKTATWSTIGFRDLRMMYDTSFGKLVIVYVPRVAPTGRAVSSTVTKTLWVVALNSCHRRLNG
jgi:hypothetical protein